MVREQIRGQGIFQDPVFLGSGSLVPYELPVGGGGHAVLLAEQLHKGFRLLVAAGVGNGRYGQEGGFQQMQGLCQAEFLDVF